MTSNDTLVAVTERIRMRSLDSRTRYVERLQRSASDGPHRTSLSCSNLVHGFAACGTDDKQALRQGKGGNIAIISAYNDMLSAHQPLDEFPDIIKAAARECGATAQFAGGVPAMCDGVTQGQPGMELSLFSRDVIAMATAVALSHNMFDSVMMLGVCDKIVPGLLVGALTFGHLPTVFVPAGPMVSGLPNAKKAKVRQLYAEGKATRSELLEAESQSYHGPGTCTFYGTANSNQLLMEIMGLHLPGSSFINPGTPLRTALTRAATIRANEITALGNDYTPIGLVVDEKAIVNGIVGLLATGGSTNHTMHLIAIAAAAGHQVTWQDFSDLSEITPLLARIYPNGNADVNHFQAAGGVGYLIRELRAGGLLHDDVRTVMGTGLAAYTREPVLADGELQWQDGPATSHDRDVLRPFGEPFQPTGGIKVLAGNLGRSVIKTSAVDASHRIVEAPARVFSSQRGFIEAFDSGELDQDVVAVVRFQGPRANGMPELHKLTPALGLLQDRGHKVALVTDGRMSGASGKVPAAIQVTPEAACGSDLARVRDGDVIRLDAEAGTLDVRVSPDALAARHPHGSDDSASQSGMGRELFGLFRAAVTASESGASVFPLAGSTT